MVPSNGVWISSLRSQLPIGVRAFGREAPRLSWQLSSEEPGLVQTSYEIEASGAPAFEGQRTSSGIVEDSRQVAVAAPGGPLQSREVRHFRARAATNHGLTPWSEPLTVEAGLLHPADWTALAITLPGDPGRDAQGPAPILRREFEIDGAPGRARLYITSHGVHSAFINGRSVGDDLLSPGWTSYARRLLAVTHDVTPLLVSGVNAIAVILGDGWYRGRLGWVPGEDRRRYGDDVALIAQLEFTLEDGRTQVVASDASWRAATAEVRRADFYDGALVDLRQQHHGWDRPGFDDRSWSGAAVVAFDTSTIEPVSSAPVREIDVRPVSLEKGPNGLIRVDTGQNLAGYLRIRARGKPGDRLTIRHAEVREPDGSLHTRALRSARATDEFILAGDSEVSLQPPFTFHGFRHADIDTEAEILGAEVVAISSDLPRRSTFSCSDPRINRLHENVLWSLRSNFVSIPTDCPQRDERVGWTGDAQAFAATACTLVDAEAFWLSWLVDLALDQNDELGVSSVVPDVVLEGEARFGRAGWADAATIVPWAVFESYGDPEVLHRQFPSMHRWVESLMRWRGSDGLLVPSWQFGDWLDPDAPPERPWMAKCDSEFIANSFFSWSARLLANAADVIGERAAAEAFRAVADRVAELTWRRWAPGVLDSQTGCAIALQFQIAPEAERAAVGDALAGLVDAAGGRVATGFLGTPLVLPALAAVDRFESAYRMLLCTEPPSWLYQVERGATTMWERWDAIRPDGSIHPGTMAAPPDVPPADEGHMLSFNHYAYGAVIDWVYRHLAGIAPVRSAPGYQNVQFAPRPVAGIDWVRAAVDSAFGTVSIDWRLEGSDLVADLVLPPGTSGSFRGPATSGSVVAADGRPIAGTEIVLGPGAHRVVVSDPLIVTL
jgi:alpha-L-rhamnosidase